MRNVQREFGDIGVKVVLGTESALKLFLPETV